MPFLLLIDTCGRTGYVAIMDAQQPHEPLAARTLPGRETQELLMTAIDGVLREANTVPTNLAAIAVVTGPGSFTGVRIGLAAAKGLAEACSLPLVALSRLAVLLHAAGASGRRTTAWLDAGRTDLYTASTADPTEAMLPRSEAIRAAERSLVAVEDPDLAGLVPEIRVLSEAELQQALATLAIAVFVEKNFADTALLDANYLRVPDAEAALLARQSA